MVQNDAIYLVPISLREANEFLEQHSPQHKPMRGCTFCVGCALDGKLVGAAIVGRCREDGQAVQIDRICATGGRAAYGMLYGAAARAAQALYALAYPNLSAAVGGSLWREGPVMI